ncbi:MAG: hypothetical protein AMXMBFR84_15850 [Candidatus Hydrogenedentota bacterium]
MHAFRFCFSIVTLVSAVSSGAQFVGGLDDLSNLKPGRSMRSSSSDPNWEAGNGDAHPIPPGETLTIAELEGPGVISHIWNTINAEEKGYSRLLVLRMYWDGEVHPSVEAPLGDFFAMGHGLDKPVESLPVRVTAEGRARNCYWPMPFGKSARITVSNEGSKPVHACYWYVDWRRLPELPEDAAYFHASYRQAFPATAGQRTIIADVKGRGHYVGTVLSVRNNMPSWFGEGDDFFYIDGEELPSLRGTGTEDYFCDAWGFREHDGPYYGAPLWEGYDVGHRGTVYRWHIMDPISFEKSLRMEIEHVGPVFDDAGTMTSGYGERPDDVATVAYWYQIEPHTPFPPLPAAYDRLLFDPRNVVEAESLLEGVRADTGAVERQDGGWSGGAQLFWTPSEPGKQLDVTFTVAEDGVYDLSLTVTFSHDYGVFQYEIDGKPVGKPVDQYGEAISNREVVFNQLELSAGKHTLTAHNTGRNPDSGGVFYGLDALMFSKRKGK